MAEKETILTVAEIAKKLNKQFKTDTLAMFADKTPTYGRVGISDMGFDFPLFGGLPEGRIVTISGRQHSGKTLGACALISAYQRKYPDKVCVYVDVEHSLDKTFVAHMTGLDLTRLLYINTQGMACEDIFAMVLELQQSSDIGVIVIDSLASMVSGADMDSDFEKDNGMRGSIAKPLHKFCRMINPMLFEKNNILVFINQVRIAGKTFTGANIYSEPAGDAPNYYSSVMIRFGTRKFTKGDKYDVTDGEGVDGIRLQFAIMKNKTANVSRGGGFITFRYDTGMDWKTDLLEVALKYDFIKRPTTQSYVLWDLVNDKAYTNADGSEKKFVGRAKLLEYLDSDVAFQNEYIKMLYDYIAETSKSYGSLLDESEREELIRQQKYLDNEIDEEEKVIAEEVSDALE